MRPGLQAIQEEPREAALCKQMGKEMIMRKGLPSRARGSQVVSLFPYVCAVQRASWKMHPRPPVSISDVPGLHPHCVRLLVPCLAWPLGLGGSGSILVKPVGLCWLTLEVNLAHGS